MLNLKVESAVAEVRSSFQIKDPPVDVVQIAKSEGILLAPSSNYGAGFHGRLEYHLEKQKFILFYPTREDGELSPRNRFSVAHELGHYYIESHREALLQGSVHNSTPGFICKEDFEREADEFAAALMIPQKYMEAKLAKQGFMELKTILELAKTCITSSQCAAIRYATFTGEACSVILSANGRVLYSVPSDEAKAFGFSYVKGIPPKAAVPEALKEPKTIKGRHGYASAWFGPRSNDPKSYEESWGLGYDDLVLTVLSLEIGDRD